MSECNHPIIFLRIIVYVCMYYSVSVRRFLFSFWLEIVCVVVIYSYLWLYYFCLWKPFLPLGFTGCYIENALWSHYISLALVQMQYTFWFFFLLFSVNCCHTEAHYFQLLFTFSVSLALYIMEKWEENVKEKRSPST